MKTKIVILNWNGVEHLRRYLGSVVRTTVGTGTVVVADNGSTDSSLAYVESEYPEVEIVRLDRNWGFAEGYNRALAQVEADYYVLLNSDVETPEGWLEPLVARLESNPTIAAVAPKVLSWCEKERFEYAGASGGFIDVLGYPFCRGRILNAIEYDHGQYDTARRVFWATGAAFACRADVYRALGGLDGDFFAHQEEIDLCWRMQRAGYEVWVEPASRVYHLGGGTLPNDSPNKIYLNFRNNLTMLSKNLSVGRRSWTIPVRLILDGCSAAVFALQGKWAFVRAVWKAHRDYFASRRVTDAKRSGSFSLPATVYRGSVLLRYAFGRKSFRNIM